MKPSFLTRAAFRPMIFASVLLATNLLAAESPLFTLINIDFGSAPGPSSEVGFAATGQTTNDFWNYYSRSGPNEEWLTFGALTNLKAADRTGTAVGLTVLNAPGMWGNQSTDPMYFSYIYPFDGGNATVTLTNLPAGTYDMYVYGNDGKYQLSSGTVSVTKTTFDDPVSNPPVWTEGKQYALFNAVQVTNAKITLTVLPGRGGYAVISGMQLLRRVPVEPPVELPAMIDVDFGSGNPGKVGLAATGRSTNDFWNFYSRDGASGEWRTFGALTGLKTVEGRATTVGLTVANAPGAWGNGSVDVMYRDYIYPFDGRNVTITITNLPPGFYDLYVYANDGNVRLTSGGVSLTRRTLDEPVINPPVWAEGRQYALFGGINVTDSTVVLTVMPGQFGYAIISGLQLVRRPSPPQPPGPLLPMIDVDFGGGNPGKVGLAATGRSANDFWNFYSRDGASGEWRTFGALTGLKTVEGASTTMGLTVANAPGAWGNGSVDVMYRDYIYPFNGGNVTITITNMPNGFYDLYVYAHDGNFRLVSGGATLARTTFESPVLNPPAWAEGKQYALFSDVSVTNATMTLTVLPGQEGWAIISGMQLVKKLTPIQPPRPSTPLFDVDFGGTNPGKVGLAAIGRSTNDFWNFYSRDGAQGEWRSFGALANLKTVDGYNTAVGLTVANAPGAWANGSVDVMYRDYIYPFDGGNVTITITNLPGGIYDFYLYANDGNFKLTSGGSTLTRRTFDQPVVNPPGWAEGNQYALFKGVAVTNSEVVLTVMPGQYGWAVISGLQISRSVWRLPVPPRTILGLDSRTNADLLRILNPSGRSQIVVYSSTNMIHWVPIYTNPPISVPLEVMIPQVTNGPQRFYRTAEFE